MNQQPMSLEAQVAALAAKFDEHQKYVEKSLLELLDASKERDRVSREELTLITTQVRATAEWQIGHASSEYHAKLAARVEEAEGHISTLREVHAERRLDANKEKVTDHEARIKAIEDRHTREDEQAEGGRKVQAKYAAAFGAGVTFLGAVIGILNQFHII